MAKNKYVDMNPEELEDLAKEQKRKNAALAELAKSDPQAVGAMMADERGAFLKQQEQARTNAWHQDIADARNRRLSSVEEIAVRDPGRYSAAQRDAAIAYLKRQESGRRFDREQDTERVVSENKMKGMIGQGAEAAAENAKATIEAGKTEWGARQKIAEGEVAAKKYLADADAAARKYGIDAEHGKVGDGGTVTPGSRERTAKIVSEGEVEKQEAASRAIVAQAEVARKDKERELQTMLDKAMIEEGGKADAAKNGRHAKIIAAALGRASDTYPAKKVLEDLKEQYKDDPEMMASLGVVIQSLPQTGGQNEPKEGERRQFADGWATFVPSKGWVKD